MSGRVILGVAGCALALAKPSIGAQAISVGPFAGDATERFESPLQSGPQSCIVVRVFGQAGDLCTDSGSADLLVLTGFVAGCVFSAPDGARFAVSGIDWVRFEFDHDIRRFGGLFATGSSQAGTGDQVIVRFLDRAGIPVAQDVLHVTDDCRFHWNGWAVDGVASIEIENTFRNGGLVCLDDLRVDFDPGVGSNYCTSNPNSTGFASILEAFGSGSLSANDLRLRSDSLPPHSFAYFLASRTPGFVANAGGSRGNLCLGGAIGRYVGPGQIQNAGTLGEVQLQIDVTQVPQPGGFVPATVGETWRFQTWYRDGDPLPTSNFSNGIAVEITL